MNIRHLEFDISDRDQAIAFGNLVMALNMNGVPFVLRQEPAINRVEITITEGY